MDCRECEKTLDPNWYVQVGIHRFCSVECFQRFKKKRGFYKYRIEKLKEKEEKNYGI